MSPVLVVFGVQGTLQVNNNMGFFAGLKEALRHLLVFCLERFLSGNSKQALQLPLPLADYKQNKLK